MPAINPIHRLHNRSVYDEVCSRDESGYHYDVPRLDVPRVLTVVIGTTTGGVVQYALYLDYRWDSTEIVHREHLGYYALDEDEILEDDVTIIMTAWHINVRLPSVSRGWMTFYPGQTFLRHHDDLIGHRD